MLRVLAVLCVLVPSGRCARRGSRRAAVAPQPFPRPGRSAPAPPPASRTPPPTAAPAPARARTAGSRRPPRRRSACRSIRARSSSRRTTPDAASATTCSARTASFVELVTYYRTALKQRGELVFEAPATHEFDIGRFREETMAFPPGVTIKDYQSDDLAGLSEPEAGRTAGALPDRHPDRAGRPEAVTTLTRLDSIGRRRSRRLAAGTRATSLPCPPSTRRSRRRPSRFA